MYKAIITIDNNLSAEDVLTSLREHADVIFRKVAVRQEDNRCILEASDPINADVSFFDIMRGEVSPASRAQAGIVSHVAMHMVDTEFNYEESLTIGDDTVVSSMKCLLDGSHMLKSKFENIVVIRNSEIRITRPELDFDDYNGLADFGHEILTVLDAPSEFLALLGENRERIEEVSAFLKKIADQPTC